MRFNIEGVVIFDTEKALLVNLLTGDCIELSQTSARLLAALLTHSGEVLARDEIFQSIFDKFGARASNSNLNQYISILRKNLHDLGIEQEIIITVPRVGFTISEHAVINEEVNAPNVAVNQRWLPFLYEKLTAGRIYFMAGGSVVFLAFIVFFFRVEEHITELIPSKMSLNQCSFYVYLPMSMQDIHNAFSLSGRVLDCSVPKKIYLYSQVIESDLGYHVQILMVECERNGNRCTSEYIREIHNA